MRRSVRAQVWRRSSIRGAERRPRRHDERTAARGSAVPVVRATASSPLTVPMHALQRREAPVADPNRSCVACAAPARSSAIVHVDPQPIACGAASAASARCAQPAYHGGVRHARSARAAPEQLEKHAKSGGTRQRLSCLQQRPGLDATHVELRVPARLDPDTQPRSRARRRPQAQNCAVLLGAPPATTRSSRRPRPATSSFSHSRACSPRTRRAAAGAGGARRDGGRHARRRARACRAAPRRSSSSQRNVAAPAVAARRAERVENRGAQARGARRATPRATREMLLSYDRISDVALRDDGGGRSGRSAGVERAGGRDVLVGCAAYFSVTRCGAVESARGAAAIILLHRRQACAAPWAPRARAPTVLKRYCRRRVALILLKRRVTRRAPRRFALRFAAAAQPQPHFASADVAKSELADGRSLREHLLARCASRVSLRASRHVCPTSAPSSMLEGPPESILVADIPSSPARSS